MADARRWGLEQEDIDTVLAVLGRETKIRVWAMHAAAVTALVLAGTQWRTRLAVGPDGVRERVIGLDYAGVAVALEGFDHILAPRDWGLLRVLEVFATRALNGEAR